MGNKHKIIVSQDILTGKWTVQKPCKKLRSIDPNRVEKYCNQLIASGYKLVKQNQYFGYREFSK